MMDIWSTLMDTGKHGENIAELVAVLVAYSARTHQERSLKRHYRVVRLVFGTKQADPIALVGDM